ncbi:MAG: signal peptidase I [Pirellulales bacterium]|nr:signal peptidase I [Pirellulales bacterium]
MATLLAPWCLFTVRMTSPSMHPTLQGSSWETGDTVLVEKLTYQVRRPRRWEIVAVRQAAGDVIAKRVVALPGETIQILKDRRIVINGRPIAKPDFLANIQYFPYGNIIYDQAYTCRRGYYLLGDDSKDSDDSRFNGDVPADQILGRVRMVIRPWKRAGVIAP